MAPPRFLASACVVGRGDGVWVARGALDATSHGLRVASRDRGEVNAIAAIVFNLNLKHIRPHAVEATYHISLYHGGGGCACTYGPSLNNARFL